MLKKSYTHVIVSVVAISIAVTIFFQVTQQGYKNFNLGLRSYNQGDYLKATQYFEKITPKQKQYAESLYYTVMSFNYLEDKVKLANALKKFSEVDKSNIDNTEWLGDTYYGIKNYKLAEQYYRTCLEEKPNSYTLKRKLSEVLIWQKNYAPAIAILQPLYEKDLLDYQTKELLADAYSWTKDYDKSIKIYKELIDSNINNTKEKLVLKLAETLRYAGKDKEAIELYDTYIKNKGDL